MTIHTVLISYLNNSSDHNTHNATLVNDNVYYVKNEKLYLIRYEDCDEEELNEAGISMIIDKGGSGNSNCPSSMDNIDITNAIPLPINNVSNGNAQPIRVTLDEANTTGMVFDGDKCVNADNWVIRNDSSSGGTLKSPPELLFEAESSNNNNNTLHVPTRTRRSKRTIPPPELNSNNNPKKRKTQRYSLPLRGNRKHSRDEETEEGATKSNKRQSTEVDNTIVPLPETGSPDDPVYSSELQMTEDDSQLFLKHRDITHQIRTTIQVTASYKGGFSGI